MFAKLQICDAEDTALLQSEDVLKECASELDQTRTNA